MGYFVVYFYIIIKSESGYTHALKYAGRQDGSGLLCIIPVVSLGAIELLLADDQRHSQHLGSSFPLTSSRVENFVFSGKAFFPPISSDFG